jgi:hypothetical protein
METVALLFFTTFLCTDILLNNSINITSYQPAILKPGKAGSIKEVRKNS